MFRRFLPPFIAKAVGDYFKKNPKHDNPDNRALYERRYRNRHGGWSYPQGDHAGSIVCARRRQQIEEGRLRVENGLVREGQVVESEGRITILRPW